MDVSLMIWRTASGTVILHYPLDALFSQIPIQLRPNIEKSKYHRKDQQGVEVTIPIEGDISSREKETMAWDMLITMIHSASRASLPGNKWKKNVTREMQAKVAFL